MTTFLVILICLSIIGEFYSQYEKMIKQKQHDADCDRFNLIEARRNSKYNG